MIITNKELLKKQTVRKRKIKMPHVDKQVRIRAHLRIVDLRIHEMAADLAHLHWLKESLQEELEENLS